MTLEQKHRPQTWDQYVGQAKAVAKVRRIIDRPGFDRGAFWIEASGANNSGVGKTTLAWLIAHQLADDFFITELSGSKVDKRAVEEIESSAHLTTWGTKPFRVWVVNEAHAMTKARSMLFSRFWTLYRDIASWFSRRRGPSMTTSSGTATPVRSHRGVIKSR